VHFCARTVDDVDKASTELSELASKSSTTATGTALDISDAAQLKQWVEGIGQVDVLVSNVSSMSMGNDPASWTTAFNVDMLAAVNLVNICLPYLEKSKGNIVTISSVSGRDIDFTATVGLFQILFSHSLLKESALTHISVAIRDLQSSLNSLHCSTSSHSRSQRNPCKHRIARKYLRRRRRLGWH
jgi:NADP-dependent 3-hydroxy acid dehydrogenase YdfG